LKSNGGEDEAAIVPGAFAELDFMSIPSEGRFLLRIEWIMGTEGRTKEHCRLDEECA
jgi:hypothetical protein